MVEPTHHHLVAGEIFRFVSSDGRTFFGQIRDGVVHLSTKKDFRGRHATVSGSDLADFLFERAKEQGRVHQRFGDARTVQPPSKARSIRPSFLSKEQA